jgi:hypothetical protein
MMHETKTAHVVGFDVLRRVSMRSSDLLSCKAVPTEDSPTFRQNDNLQFQCEGISKVQVRRSKR